MPLTNKVVNKLYKKIVLGVLVVGTVLLPLKLALATDLQLDGTSNFNVQSNSVLQTIKDNTKLGGYDNVASQGPIETTALIVNFLLGLLGSIALALTVYAGYIWLIARGDESEIERAKAILVGSVTGMLLVLSSYTVLGYVFRSFVSITN